MAETKEVANAGRHEEGIMFAFRKSPREATVRQERLQDRDLPLHYLGCSSFEPVHPGIIQALLEASQPRSFVRAVQKASVASCFSRLIPPSAALLVIFT